MKIEYFLHLFCQTQHVWKINWKSCLSKLGVFNTVQMLGVIIIFV